MNFEKIVYHFTAKFVTQDSNGEQNWDWKLPITLKILLIGTKIETETCWKPESNQIFEKGNNNWNQNK